MRSRSPGLWSVSACSSSIPQVSGARSRPCETPAFPANRAAPVSTALKTAALKRERWRPRERAPISRATMWAFRPE